MMTTMIVPMTTEGDTPLGFTMMSMIVMHQLLDMIAAVVTCEQHPADTMMTEIIRLPLAHHLPETTELDLIVTTLECSKSINLRGRTGGNFTA